MPKFTKNVVIEGVDRIWRPGIGYVYKGRISIGDLALALINGDIKYAPKYQRGPKPSDDNDFDAHTLLQITDPNLDISEARAEAMAAKYLLGLQDHKHREFYNPDVMWNARLDPEFEELVYNAAKRTLTAHGVFTIPDSAHRHFADFLLYKWWKDPDSIPDEVVIAEDGESIDGGELQKWIKNFDPFDEEKSSTFVTIFNVPADHEGRLFDEYNVEGKKPSTSASIDMYSEKTASRRFVAALMKKCPIFDRAEIEMRRNTIGKASRKITTVATLDTAIKPFSKKLLEFENNKALHDDLVDFYSHFYTEWAVHVPEFQPTASGKARQELRKTSYAMSNILFFPMFRLAFELWEKYTKAGADWHSETEWKDALAKLAGDVTTKDETGKKVTIPVMARESDESDGNPDWQGKILIQQFDPNGKPKGWSLSSTRQTRDAAYHYLVQVSGVALPTKKTK